MLASQVATRVTWRRTPKIYISNNFSNFGPLTSGKRRRKNPEFRGNVGRRLAMKTDGLITGNFHNSFGRTNKPEEGYNLA